MSLSNYKIKCLNCDIEFDPRQRFCCDNCRKRYNENIGRKRPKTGRKRPKIENNGNNRTETSLNHKLVFNIKRGVYE